jgi:hypothetical protein
MRIGGVGDRPAPSSDLATALSGAVARLGQRPAVTAHGPQGRHEQGFVSLAGWSSKGANLLRDEFGLAAGDRLGIASPPGWPLAAVVLSAWWLGITIVPASAPGLALSVRHVTTPGGSPTGDVLWIGDALDGTGVPPVDGDECWADAVIPHPDRAPTPSHDGTATAIDLADPLRPGAPSAAPAPTQLQLLAAVTGDDRGALGIVRHGDEDLLARSDAVERLTALVIRPLVTGAASVVLSAEDVDRGSISAAERVVRWLG